MGGKRDFGTLPRARFLHKEEWQASIDPPPKRTTQVQAGRRGSHPFGALIVLATGEVLGDGMNDSASTGACAIGPALTHEAAAPHRAFWKR